MALSSAESALGSQGSIPFNLRLTTEPPSNHKKTVLNIFNLQSNRLPPSTHDNNLYTPFCLSLLRELYILHSYSPSIQQIAGKLRANRAFFLGPTRPIHRLSSVEALPILVKQTRNRSAPYTEYVDKVGTLQKPEKSSMQTMNSPCPVS